MKSYLVTSNGELLIVDNTVSKGSLLVFEKEVIFHEFDLCAFRYE